MTRTELQGARARLRPEGLKGARCWGSCRKSLGTAALCIDAVLGASMVHSMAALWCERGRVKEGEERVNVEHGYITMKLILQVHWVLSTCLSIPASYFECPEFQHPGDLILLFKAA